MDPLRARLLRILGVGRIKRVDDSGPIQKIQVEFQPSADGSSSIDLHDNIPVIGLYGFTSNPPLESEVHTTHLGGNRSAAQAIGHNHQKYRLRGLKPGDSALYDIRGAYAWFREDGLVIDAAGLPVTVQNSTKVTIKASESIELETPTVHCTENLQVDGNITVKGNQTIDGSLTVTGDIKSGADITAAGDISGNV